MSQSGCCSRVWAESPWLATPRFATLASAPPSPGPLCASAHLTRIRQSRTVSILGLDLKGIGSHTWLYEENVMITHWGQTPIPSLETAHKGSNQHLYDFVGRFDFWVVGTIVALVKRLPSLRSFHVHRWFPSAALLRPAAARAGSSPALLTRRPGFEAWCSGSTPARSASRIWSMGEVLPIFAQISAAPPTLS